MTEYGVKILIPIFVSWMFVFSPFGRAHSVTYNERTYSFFQNHNILS